MQGLHHAAHGVRQADDDVMPCFVQGFFNGFQQAVHIHAPLCGDGNHVGSVGDILRIDQICLVIAAQNRGFRLCQLGNQLLHHLNVLLPVGIGGIDDVQQKVGILQLFQRRVEGVYQMVGELGDKADSITEDHIQIFRHGQLPGGGVQRIKQPVIGRDARTGQLIQEGRFACVGVAYDGNHRNGILHPALALNGADFAHLLQFGFQPVDPLPDVTAVRFQLGFAGTPGADAAALAGKACAHTGQPGQQVFILGQLHLKAAFLGLGPLGEDIQDQGTSVQNRDANDLLQSPDIAGRQLIIKYDHGGGCCFHQHFYFQGLTLANEAVGIGGMAVLQHLAGAEAAGGFQKGFQLFHGFVGGDLVFSEAVCVQSHQDGTLLHMFFKCGFHSFPPQQIPTPVCMPTWNT